MKSAVLFMMLKKEGFIDNKNEQTAEKIIDEICKRFVLTPSDDFSDRSNIFHNMKIGFFKEKLTEEEMIIYEKLWSAEIESWKIKTNDPMSGYDIMLLDNTIILFLKGFRIAGPEMKLDLTTGSPGWISDQLLQKNLKLMFDTFPKKKQPTGPKPKKAEKEIIPELEPEKERFFIYKGKEMTEQEYNNWYETLDDKAKADVLAHVKIIEK